MNAYRVRVYFEDTDCGQIVYHTNYMKYCERARSELFFSQGLLPIHGQSGFVLKSLNAEFVASARLGDLLEVRTQVLKSKNVSIELEQAIYRVYDASKQCQCEEKVFTSRVLLAFFDMGLNRVCKIPVQILEILNKGAEIR